jgi:hypothetical protein
MSIFTTAAGGASVVSATVQTVGVVAAGVAVGAGAYLAYGDAQNLYNSRSEMANQFQQQSEFPGDLTSTGKFYISFLFQEYVKRSIYNSPFLRSRGTIRLPIPDNLKDNTSVSYSAPDIDPLVGAALEQAAKNREETGSAISSFQSGVKIGTAALQGAGMEFIQGLQDTNAGKGIRSYLGLTINPYQTVLFERPNFKTHTFTWKLIPKNDIESGTIKNIISTFQYHALPGISDNLGLIFSFPSMVTVNLYPSNTFLYRFKPAVIESISVNYAPGSTPSFYRGTDAPTAVTITIQLKEIEYWTNKDYASVRSASAPPTTPTTNNELGPAQGQVQRRYAEGMENTRNNFYPGPTTRELYTLDAQAENNIAGGGAGL